MGYMESVIQYVGVIINTYVLSVYCVHARGGVNAYVTINTYKHDLQNMQFFCC